MRCSQPSNVPGRVLGQRPEHPDERLLGEVLGVGPVAGEPVGEPVDAVGVLAHDLVPGRRNPRCGAPVSTVVTLSRRRHWRLRRRSRYRNPSTATCTSAKRRSRALDVPAAAGALVSGAVHSYTAGRRPDRPDALAELLPRPAGAWTVPLDRPLTPHELDAAGRRRPSPRPGIGRDEALRLWADVLGPGLPVGRPPPLPVLHPERARPRPPATSTCSSARPASTAARGSRAPARSTPRTRRCAGSPTSPGCPPEAGGAFVQGGTVGNLSALVAAREAALERRGGAGPRAGRSASPRRRTRRSSTRCRS